MRDVFEEMSLDGVRPTRDMYHSGLFSTMKARKLGDALFFWEEMQRSGHQPDVKAFTAIICAAGRCGQVAQAVELRAEMAARGFAPNHNTFLALLNTYAEAGKLDLTRSTFEEMAAAGCEPDAFAYAALINCFRHVPKAHVPPDAEARLQVLLAEGLAALDAGNAADGSSEGEDEDLLFDEFEGGVGGKRQDAARPGREGRNLRALIVYNAALNALVELG